MNEVSDGFTDGSHSGSDVSSLMGIKPDPVGILLCYSESFWVYIPLIELVGFGMGCTLV